MFVSNITTIAATADLTVATAGGETAPVGYVDIVWQWSGDSGTMHNHTIKEILFFPDSLVNILGVSKWAVQSKDVEGTYITSKAHYSIFVWNFRRHTRRFTHSATMLLELSVNEGTTVINAFCSAFGSIFPSKATSLKCFRSSFRREEPSINTSMLNGNAKTCSEAKSELPAKAKAVKTLTNTKISFSDCCNLQKRNFAVGSDIEYLTSSHAKNVRIVEIMNDEKMNLSYKVCLDNDKIIVVNFGCTDHAISA